MAPDIEIRNGTPEDSRELAELMNVAADGIPAYLWSLMAEPGDDVMAFGADRVRGTDGAFSFVNAHVAVASGAVAGMLLGYRLPDPYVIESLEEYPDFVRPAVELEAQAPGSWYVNAIATYETFRGQGIGSRLMRLAEDLAHDAGADALSLIVAEENARARALYERLEYRPVTRRPIIPFPGCPHEGDWILMRKDIDA